MWIRRFGNGCFRSMVASQSSRTGSLRLAWERANFQSRDPPAGIRQMVWFGIDSVDSAFFGWPVNRRRRYTLLRHKLKSLPFRSPFSIFSKMFCRAPLEPDEDFENGGTVAPVWSCFMVATLDELRDELRWAGQRPASVASEQSTNPSELDPLCGESYHLCLTTCEQRFLAEYERRFPNCAYSLNQNPEFGATHSTRKHLHCLIKNLGLIWMLGYATYILAGGVLTEINIKHAKASLLVRCCLFDILHLSF